MWGQKGSPLQRPSDRFDETVSIVVVVGAIAAVACIFWPTIREAVGTLVAFMGSI